MLRARVKSTRPLCRPSTVTCALRCGRATAGLQPTDDLDFWLRQSFWLCARVYADDHLDENKGQRVLPCRSRTFSQNATIMLPRCKK
ncbi:hypothetical protein BDV19DRAFT_357877 [Aspergillus venezuelensis]